MPTEIYWTAEGADDPDLLPGVVTQVRREKRELRVFFSGADTAYGARYEGVIRLVSYVGGQRMEGNLTYKSIGDEIEIVPFVVTGAFASSNFESFSGTWIEKGRTCRVDIVGLPASSERKAGGRGTRNRGKAK
jgi:hypothetical protein